MVTTWYCAVCDSLYVVRRSMAVFQFVHCACGRVMDRMDNGITVSCDGYALKVVPSWG